MRDNNKRIDWVDLTKGILTFLVILSHVQGTHPIKHIIDSYFLIPGFFIVSGYLSKYKKNEYFDFIYNRIFKLLLIYLIWCLLLQFISFENIKNIINDPFEIFNTIYMGILSIGNNLWYVACLIVSTILFLFNKVISKENDYKLILFSIGLFIIGLLITEENVIRIWSFDIAFVCQIFYTIGYLVRKNNLLNKKEFLKRQNILTVLSIAIYIVFLVFATRISSHVSIDICKAAWHNLLLTIPGFILGNTAFILFCVKINKLKLINYIGKHSLVYFAVGNIPNHHLISLFGKMGIYNILSPAYVSIIVAIISYLFTLIICWLIDKFFPVLNGKFKLPNLKKHFKIII